MAIEEEVTEVAVIAVIEGMPAIEEITDIAAATDIGGTIIAIMGMVAEVAEAIIMGTTEIAAIAITAEEVGAAVGEAGAGMAGTDIGQVLAT